MLQSKDKGSSSKPAAPGSLRWLAWCLLTINNVRAKVVMDRKRGIMSFLAEGFRPQTMEHTVYFLSGPHPSVVFLRTSDCSSRIRIRPKPSGMGCWPGWALPAGLPFPLVHLGWRSEGQEANQVSSPSSFRVRATLIWLCALWRPPSLQHSWSCDSLLSGLGHIPPPCPFRLRASSKARRGAVFHAPPSPVLSVPGALCWTHLCTLPL